MHVLTGKHWSLYQKEAGPKITKEEIEKLLVRVPIAHNDPTAICTRAGWEIWQKYRLAAMRKMNQEVKFIYKQGTTEIEVWAKDEKEALAAIRQGLGPNAKMENLSKARISPQDIGDHIDQTPESKVSK